MFQQTCLRDDEVLTRADITAVMIHADGRPRRPLPEMVEQIKPFIYSGSAV